MDKLKYDKDVYIIIRNIYITILRIFVIFFENLRNILTTYSTTIYVKNEKTKHLILYQQSINKTI